jgi:hypothetical protein
MVISCHVLMNHDVLTRKKPPTSVKINHQFNCRSENTKVRSENIE